MWFLWICIWRQDLLFLWKKLLYELHDRWQNPLQTMLYSQKKARMEATSKKEQSCAYFCWIAVALCCFSWTVISGTRPNILYNIYRGRSPNHDTNWLGVIFLVTKSTKFRFKEKKRLESFSPKIKSEFWHCLYCILWLNTMMCK